MKSVIGMRTILLTSLVLCFTFIFSACASAGKPKEESYNDEPNPITLKIHFGEDENFIDSYIKPVEDAFPYITFEHVEGEYDDLIAEGNIPDILFFWNKEDAAEAAEYELTYDMTDLIEESGFDISRFYFNNLAEWQVGSKIGRASMRVMIMKKE